MRIVALEEHFATRDIVEAWQDIPPESRDYAVAKSTGNEKERMLLEIGRASCRERV